MPFPSLIPEVLDRPGTHALVIGVSRYRHVLGADEETGTGSEFAIDQLQSAARTAHRFATWLLQRPYEAPMPPLASLRVLLSPQPGEIDRTGEDPRLATAPAATRSNVLAALRAFRSACEKQRDSHAVVYVVGHGAQITTHGALLLLEDFASDEFNNLLDGALDMIGIHRALRNDRAAHQQCWFVDVCRQRADVARAIDSYRPGNSLDFGSGDVQTSPLILAAMEDTQAHSLREGHSLLCEALVEALDSAAVARGPDGVVGQWHVPFSTLCEWLPHRVRELARHHRVDQFVEITGLVNPGVFHVYHDHPEVDLTVTVRPETVGRNSRFELFDKRRTPVHASADWPITTRVRAGLYNIQIDAPSYRPYWDTLDLKPPRHAHDAELLP